MWVKFLRSVPMLDTPEYRDLMANREPDSLVGLTEMALLGVLRQASCKFPMGLLGYDLGELAMRAGLTVQQVMGSVESLGARGFLEIQGGSENPTETRQTVALDVVGAWNRRAEQNNRLAGSPKLVRVARLTEERRRKIAARLREPDWWGAFQYALRMVPLESRPCFSWQPSLDWIISNGNNVFKLAEGQYSAR